MNNFIISLINSSYQRNFNQSNTNSGISSYPLMSPIDTSSIQSIMWSNPGQTEDYLETRGGKLPEFHRFQSGASFISPPKNPHFTSPLASVSNLFVFKRLVNSMEFLPTKNRMIGNNKVSQIHTFPMRFKRNLWECQFHRLQRESVHHIICQHLNRSQPVSTKL